MSKSQGFEIAAFRNRKRSNKNKNCEITQLTLVGLWPCRASWLRKAVGPFGSDKDHVVTMGSYMAPIRAMRGHKAPLIGAICHPTVATWLPQAPLDAYNLFEGLIRVHEAL